MDVDEFKDFFFNTIILRPNEYKRDCLEKFAVTQDIGTWSGPELVGMLNYAVSCLDEGEEYLEIGTYTGQSLVGALLNNSVKAQVIDNFWEGELLKSAWESNVRKFQMRDRVTLHYMNAEDFNGELPKIGFLFYDGNHDSGFTYEGIKQYSQYLTDRAIVIVDDYMIVGGYSQKPFPGHPMDPEIPVKTDVDRLLREDDRFQLLGITEWGQSQAIMEFIR